MKGECFQSCPIHVLPVSLNLAINPTLSKVLFSNSSMALLERHHLPHLSSQEAFVSTVNGFKFEPIIIHITLFYSIFIFILSDK